MNWREGGRRLARVTAWAYLVIALVSVFNIAQAARVNPGEPHTINVHGPSDPPCYFEVWADHRDAAERSAYSQLLGLPKGQTYPCGSLDAPSPLKSDLGSRNREMLRDGLTAAAWFAGIYLALMFAFRAARWVLNGFFPA